MRNQVPRLGIDRFLALRWVDMALELRVAGFDKAAIKAKLWEWLPREITGKEVVEKTIIQLNRMWFPENRTHYIMGDWLIQNGLTNDLRCRPVLHHGMGIIVYPLYRDICQVTGRLIKLQKRCSRKEITLRVLEKYTNPETTKRAINRVLQTLVDWRILVNNGKAFAPTEILVTDPKLIEWLVMVFLQVYGVDQLPFLDLLNSPEFIGIKLDNARAAIHSASQLLLNRVVDIEMISSVD